MTAATPQANPRPIHPLVDYNPQQMETSNIRWSRLWAVAAIVTAVAFIGLASVAFAYSSLYLESQLLLVSILIFAVGMPASYRAFNSLWEKSQGYANDASLDQKIIKHMKDVDVPAALRKLGVRADTEQRDLSPVLGRYNFYQAQKEAYVDRADQILKDHPSVSVSTLDPSSQEQMKAYHDAQEEFFARERLLEKAAFYHIQSALCLSLMHSPHGPEENESNAKTHFIALSPVDRFIAEKYGDRSAWGFVKTANGTIYTARDILQYTPYQLARRFFSLPRYGLLG